MKVTFNKQDLADNNARNALVNIINDAKHGGFMRIHGFESKTGHGEVQDATYCKGISYPNAVAKSLDMLCAIEADPKHIVTVTRGVWVDSDGKESPSGRKNKGKGFVHAKTVTETYDMESPVMVEAIAKIRKSLTAPERPSKDYKKLGNGVYEDEETGTLYVRDLRLVSKHIVVHGDYPFKAGKAVTAVADAIKREMPIGKYRMFRMDATFDKVTLGGIELAPEQEQTEKIEQVKTEVPKVAVNA